jgi:tRNA(fMet)-specific endonuclease VapC
VSGIVVDTSVWIDFFNGARASELEDALSAESLVLAPLVIAELVSGARSVREREEIRRLVSDLAVHDTPVEHWMRVGALRHDLRNKGLSVSTPDAHIAQCALDLNAVLLSRDAVFQKIAKLTPLRLHSLYSH